MKQVGLGDGSVWFDSRVRNVYGRVGLPSRDSAGGVVPGGVGQDMGIESFRAGADPGGLAEVIEYQLKEGGGALGEVAVHGIEGGLDVLPGFFRVEEVGINRLEKLGI